MKCKGEQQRKKETINIRTKEGMDKEIANK